MDGQLAWWVWVLAGAGSLALFYILLNLKTSRPDGVLVKPLPEYRQMLLYALPRRNESIVYYDTFPRAERLLDYLEQANKRFPCDITHCLVGAATRGLADNPRMNQFVVGRRLYARKTRAVTFSMKRKRLNKEAKLSAVKLEMPDGETFEQLCARINGQIDMERSGKKTYSDKEFDLLTKVPRPLMVRAMRFLSWLDYHNLLPGGFIKGDGMYTSMFVANLGSLSMGAGFHHLYEWGTCPLFLMVGKIEERAVVENGQVVPRKLLHLRWSYEERIDDGLTSRFGIESVNRALENPFKFLGCLAEDGSDACSLSEPMGEDLGTV